MAASRAHLVGGDSCRAPSDALVLCRAEPRTAWLANTPSIRIARPALRGAEARRIGGELPQTREWSRARGYRREAGNGGRRQLAVEVRPAGEGLPASRSVGRHG